MQKQDTRTEHQRLIAVSPDLQNGNTIAHGDETNAAINGPKSKCKHDQSDEDCLLLFDLNQESDLFLL